MWNRPRILTAALSLTLATLIPVALHAQNPNDFGDDPPGRAARLSAIEGSVSFQPGGVDDWVAATLNRPITTGDRLWTDPGARTELNLGSAAFRMNGRTSLTLLNLTDNDAQLELSSGVLNIRVRNLASGENLEIDTPQAAFLIQQPGDYRVEVSDQGDATIATVRAGEMEADTDGRNFTIRSREQVRVTEGNDGPNFDRRNAPVADAFDNWSQDRDRREDRSQSARYVSRDIPGYADLDDQGVWTPDPEYTMIWMPRVSQDWAPYRYGHWAWVDPWGWTWVDDASWGYAPFHYGRWVSRRGAWGWVPGPMGVRPLYSPALVAWVGGSNFSIGISIGGPAVGWFPLAPREVWVPPYRYSSRYIERVNVTNTVIVNRNTFVNINVNNMNYVNRNVNGAVTAVPRDVMVGGRPIGRQGGSVPQGAAARGQIGAFAPVVPQRAALLDGHAPGRSAPPPAVVNRGAVTRTAPPPAPVTFDRRQSALQGNQGRPLDRATVNQLRQAQPAPQRPAFRQANAPPQLGRPQQPAPQNTQPLPPPVPEQPRGRGQQSQFPQPPTPVQPAPQPAAPEQPRNRGQQRQFPQQQIPAPPAPVQPAPVQPAPQPVPEQPRGRGQQRQDLAPAPAQPVPPQPAPEQPRNRGQQRQFPQQQIPAPPAPVQPAPVQPAPQPVPEQPRGRGQQRQDLPPAPAQPVPPQPAPEQPRNRGQQRQFPQQQAPVQPAPQPNPAPVAPPPQRAAPPTAPPPPVAAPAQPRGGPPGRGEQRRQAPPDNPDDKKGKKE